MSDRSEEALGTVLVNEPHLEGVDLEAIDSLVFRLADLFDEWSHGYDDDQDSPTYDSYVKSYRLKV